MLVNEHGDDLRETGNGVSGLPQWARVVALVGIPGTIALYLVYSLASFATTGVAQLHQQMEVHAAVMLQHDAQSAKSVETLRQETFRTTEALQRVLMGICLNTAETNEDRQRCVR